MKYAILAAALLFSFPVVAQDSDPYGSPDPVGSSYNDSNQQWYEHAQQEQREQQLTDERNQAEQQVQEIEDRYPMQSPEQQFISQYGDCYTCQ